MTNKDASGILKTEAMSHVIPEVREALLMGANALDQEPCEDAISRREAIEEIRFGQSFITKIHPTGKIEHLFDKENKALETAVERIEALPSVTPKQRTGHWEWVQYDYNHKLGNWQCSECRCVVVECVNKEEKGGIPLYKYCPQCGAKIQEVEE